jgi:rSAM/selenodomain-associated transferase 1
MASSEPPKVRIAVFAKAPIPGEVKTRLQGILGAEGAAALHAGLVRHALATAIESRAGSVELHCAPDERHEFFAACADRFRVPLAAQAGADLGERMRNAFDRAFAANESLVIIGSDCPVLHARDLRDAVAALESHDAVIAPAEDGGYALIGLAAPVAKLFDEVEWGTDAVLRQTRARFAAERVSCVELREVWDVDRPEDYARLMREGLLEQVLS